MTKAVLAALGFLVVISAAGAGARAPEPDSPPVLDDLLEPIREKHDLPAWPEGSFPGAAWSSPARGETDFQKPETFAKLHAPPDDGDYALGWMVTRRPWAGGVALTHAGSNSMWFAVTWLAPGKDFAVMAVTNSGGSSAPAACVEAVGAMIQSFLDR